MNPSQNLNAPKILTKIQNKTFLLKYSCQDIKKSYVYFISTLNNKMYWQSNNYLNFEVLISINNIFRYFRHHHVMKMSVLSIDNLTGICSLHSNLAFLS